MRHALVIITLLLSVFTARAQEDPEYRMEIGGGIGLVAYQGDFNGSLMKNMQAMGSVLARYRFNPRMGLAMNIGYGRLKGASDGTQTWYPAYSDTVVAFDSKIVDAGVRFEYNFWPYGTGREYRGAQRFTPYVALGLGLTYASTDGGSVVTGNMPIGIGVKYKAGTRVNVGLEWAMRFSMSDKLDGVADPTAYRARVCSRTPIATACCSCR